MICSKCSENIDIKMDDNALKQVPKFRYVVSTITGGWKNTEDIIQRTKEAKVMFNNKKQLLGSNNVSLEMKKNIIKSFIWSVALYGSETWTLGKNEEMVVNAFGTFETYETWCWRRMLKIKCTDRITNDEDFQRAKEERLLLKIKKILCASYG
jgi:hypothetical protein